MPHKILIVKIGAIGDVVMALPILEAIRRRYPQSSVTWVCGNAAAPLVRATEFAQLIEVDDKKLLAGSFLTKIVQLCKVWRQIGGKRYDLILTLHPDPRYRLLSLLTFGSRQSWKKTGHYHAEEYVALIDPDSDITFPSIRSSLRPDLVPIVQRKPLIVVAPGGAKNTLSDDGLRRWPIQFYEKLIKELTFRGISVIVTGSETDQWVLPHLQNANFQSLIGQLDLLDLISLLQNSSLLITHDSGPLHLAKIASCPTIALFGPTHPREKVSERENIRVIWGGENLACRPCYNGKTYASCKNNLCLASIMPETVLQMALQMVR